MKKRAEGNTRASSEAALWEEKLAALEGAFRKLKIKQNEQDKTANKITYKSAIPGIARQLMLMVPILRPKVASDKRGLRNLAQSTGRTVKALDDLSPAALAALNYRPTALRELKSKLRILHAAAETVEFKARIGQPKKIQPKIIARVVAQHYYHLTDREPALTNDAYNGGKANGQFVELLRTVYKTLGIKASAPSQAKLVNKEWPAFIRNNLAN